MVSKDQALRILGLGEGSTPSLIHQSYLTKKVALENRRDNAPTASLKQRYQAELEQLQEARDTLLRDYSSEGLKAGVSPGPDLPSPKPVGGRKVESTAPSSRPSSECSESCSPGSVLLNRYEIVRQIQRGRVGVIYEAHDRNREETIAIRVIPPELIADDSARQNFVAQAKTVSALFHPGIAKVHDLEKTESVTFLTMEMVKGKTLREEMEERKETRKQFSLDEIRKIGLGLCDALNYAHQSTIHGAMEPGQVWLCRDGSVKLSGFGTGFLISRARPDREEPDSTAVYLAPEQVDGVREADSRSDQYGVAAILYEMLAGEPPSGRGKPSKESSSNIPYALNAVLRKALSRKPEGRFGSMKSFGTALSLSARASLKTVIMAAACVVVVLGLSYPLFLGDWISEFQTNRRYSAAMSDGREAVASQKWDKAVESFKRAIQIKAGAPDAQLGLQQAEKGLAEQKYQNAVAEGRAALGKNSPREAEEAFKRAISMRPEGTEALQGLQQAKAGIVDKQYQKEMESGRDALKRKNWSQAREAFLRALSAKDGDSAALYGLEQAEQGDRKASYDSHMKAGQGELVKQNWDSAIESFNRALAIKEGDLDALKGKKQGEEGKLNEFFTTSMRKANSAMEKEKWKEAEDEFQKAVNAKPDEKEAKEGLAKARAKIAEQRLEEARRIGGRLDFIVYPATATVTVKAGDEPPRTEKSDKGGQFTIKALPLDLPVVLEISQPGWATKSVGPIVFSVDKLEVKLDPVKLEHSRASMSVMTIPERVKVQANKVDVGETGDDSVLLVPNLRTGLPVELKLSKEGYEPRAVTVTIPDSFQGSTYRLDTISLSKAGTKDKAPAGTGPDALFAAAKSGDFEQLKKLLETGVNVNSKDPDNVTALAWACDSGHPEAVKLLLEKGADPNTKDNIGATPLMWAAKKGKPESLKLLLDKQAAVNEKDNSGNSPLMWAAAEGNSEAAGLLLERGAKADEKNSEGLSAITLSAEAGDAKTVQTLLAKGVNPNSVGPRSRTALYEAAEKGHAEVVKALLEKGADPDIESAGNWTPIVAAADGGRREVVELLLKKGAKKNRGLAAKVADLRGHPEIGKLIRQSGGR